MSNGTESERDPDGRIISLRHTSDPLGDTRSRLSAIETARAYVPMVAAQYGFDPELIEQMEKRVPGEFQPDEGAQLKLQEARPVGSFTIVTFQQVYRGLPVWEGGLVVRMRGPQYVITGSASNVFRQIEISYDEEPPEDRQEKAEELLRELAEKAGLYDLKVNASRDMVYRYEAARRLPPPEHGAPEPLQESPLLPKLDVGKVPRSVKDGSFRFVREVLFGTNSEAIGELNWRALIDWRTNAILYIRPLVADVNGCVFRNDPISLSGNPELDPNASVALLDAQQELVTLERLILPPAPAPVSLSGQYVAVQDLDPPNIAAPTEAGGPAASFCYASDSDDYAAVCAYYTHDWLYRLVETLGFNLATYFDGATFPVPVDHRWLNIVNAQAPGNAMGNGILRYRYSLADSASTVGIATDPRVVAHEFGHGILWDHLSSPNFGFAHGFGDALAAILFDPESQTPDRFRTFPFNNVILRRHDRAVASGWGWGGAMDVGGYLSTQIVSTTIFRIYRSLGGDDASLDERQHASRYTTYLMLQGAPLLSGVIPNTTQGFASAMQESDQGTTTFEGFAGGWAHKVVRWGFEKQNLYGGAPPRTDIYIEDGRAGEYPFTADLQSASGIWNRHRPDGGTDHETPRAGIENYLYVRVSNRGSELASAPQVHAYRATANKGRIWPDDWSSLGAVVVAAQAVLPNESVVVGPIPWCPRGPCEERVLASATVRDDRSNATTISGRLPTRRLALADNNVAMRAMDTNHPDEDEDCLDGQKVYRYAVKFVCGCSKGKVVSSGSYLTAINVRNTSDKDIEFTKRFTIALPGEQPGNVSGVTRNKLGPFEALEIDCDDIARHSRMPEGCFIKGFAVIDSKVELDVVSVYTAAKSGGEIETIDVEEIRPRIVKQERRKPPPPPDDKTPPPDDKVPPPEKTKLADLIPVKPFPSGPPPYPSNYCASPRELHVIVRNQGDGPAGPSTTRVEYIDVGIIEERSTPALSPGQETVPPLTFPIPPNCAEGQICHFRITVNAIPADNVAESDTGNNTDNGTCGLVT